MKDIKVADAVRISEEYDSAKHDHTIDADMFQINESFRAYIPAGLFGGEGIRDYKIEDTPLRQLCAKLGPVLYGSGSGRTLPFAHYRDLSEKYPHWAAYELNDLLADMTAERGEERARLFVRCHGDNVRAVLSPQYADIANTDLIKMVQEIEMDSGDFDLVRPWIGRDSFVLKSIVKWGPHPMHPNSGDSVGLGFVISNNEVGNGSAVVEPVVQLTSCTNSIVAMRDEEGNPLGVRLSHRGNTASKMTLLQAAIIEVLPNAELVLDKYIAAHKKALPKIGDVIMGLGKQLGWNEDMRLLVASGTKGESSVGALVDGITWAAHSSGMDSENQLIMERIGGDLLFGKAASHVLSQEYVYLPE